MTDIEKQLDQAILEQRQGLQAFEFGQDHAELKNLLLLAQSLKALPKAEVPAPLLRRKYAASKQSLLHWYWLSLPRFALASAASLVMTVFLGGTIYAGLNSHPGQTLFVVKKSEEQLQLLLANSQDAKAVLQLSIAKIRLQDAQTILNNPGSDLSQKTAALTELANQTQNAIAVVNAVTKDSPNSDKTQPLLNSLAQISQQQQTLLASVKPDQQVAAAAPQALADLNNSAKQLGELEKAMTVSSRDQGLAVLTANPDAVAVLGELGQISASTLTVEKTTFILSPSTQITNSNGDKLTIKDLKPKLKVNVVGSKTNNVLTANTIFVADADNNQPANSDATTTAAVIKSATSTPTLTKDKPTADETQITNDNDATTTDSAQINSSTAVGGYILEDPSPQFSK